MKAKSLLAALLLVPLSRLPAAEPLSPGLPFDPHAVSRLSLDGKPRSLSIRQGSDTWLGYDLERATVFKAWRAPAAKPGLIKTEFVTRSAGQALFEDPSNSGWELQSAGKIVPLKSRYLGCTRNQDHTLLRWELRHDTGFLTLEERVPLSAASITDRVVRELRVASLAKGEALLPPSAARTAWKLVSGNVSASPVFTDSEWHRLTLP